MRREHLLRVFLFAFCGMPLVGCGASRSYDPTTALRIRARTASQFARGVYYKPGDHAMVGLEKTLEPLIIDQTDVRKPKADSLICTPVGDGGCDPGVATVYSGVSKVRIGDHDFDEVVYVWFYGSSGERVLGRGVRIVMGRDGFPMVWEALSSSASVRVLYVSRTLEDQAIARFESPHAERSFVVERSVGDAPQAVVARILADGPMAMGPWVYVGRSPSREIVTFLCRCMPSQVDEFVRTIKYDLRPVEAIPDGGHADWVRGLLSVEDLSDVLRWPAVGAVEGERD